MIIFLTHLVKYLLISFLVKITQINSHKFKLPLTMVLQIFFHNQDIELILWIQIRYLKVLLIEDSY